jgi:hypothetical protein
MQNVSHQTIRLRRGRHSSPREGACVMELASMLAGEPFSDHPRCVSRGIAAFLRTYNDLVDDERRQDLYEYAAKAVGTSGSEHVERLRALRFASWGDQMRQRKSPWRIGILRRREEASRMANSEEAARYAAAAIRKPSRESHAAALALVDELISMGSAGASEPVTPPSSPAVGLPENGRAEVPA